MPPISPYNSPDLLGEARAGSPRALGIALDAFRPLLVDTARRQLSTRLQAKGDASDIVQETFFDAFVHFDSFRGVSPAELTAWLRKLLTNRLAKFSRSYRTQRRCAVREVSLTIGAGDMLIRVEISGSIERPDQAASREEVVAAVQDALCQLSESARQVIELRHWERLTFAEVAQRTGRTEAAVRKMCSRGLDHLRHHLERDYGTSD